MNKGAVTRNGVLFLALLVSILMLLPVNSTSLLAKNNQGASEKENYGEKSVRVRERYYEGNSNYQELPELETADPGVYGKSWTLREYGVDENPYGIIGEAVVNYSFRTPKNWSVKNTVRRFASGEDMLIFRITGEKGIWGIVTKVKLSGTSIDDEKEFARYYANRRSDFMALLEDIDGAEVSTKLHFIQGLTTGKSEEVSHYESYSTMEFPDGKYANIAQYLLQKDLGYVVDMYIPHESLNQRTRSIAYMIGRSFTVYRFR